MRKIIACLLLICVAAMPFYTFSIASAATLTEKSVTFMPDDISLLIKGRVIDSPKIKPISVAVYRPGYTPEMVYDGTATADEAISHIKNVQKDSNGYFEWKYKLNEAKDIKGEYTVYFSLDDIKESVTVFVADRELVDEALLQVNSGEGLSIDEKKAVIQQYKDSLSLDFSVYDMIKDAAVQEEVIEALFEQQYEKPSEVQAAFISESVLKLAGNAKNNSDIEYLIENHNDLLGIDLENKWYVSKIAGNPNRMQLVITSVRQNGSYDDFTEVADQFQKGVIVEAVNAHQSPGEIYNIISDERNKGLLKISFEEYKRVKDKGAVLDQMTRRDYETCDDIVDRWNKAVADQLYEERYGGGIGSGGGGGGFNPTPNTGSVKPQPGQGENIGIEEGKKDQDGEIIFTDLGSAMWAKSSIEALAKAGIVNGKTATTFAPNDNITREEFVKMLFLSANLKPEEGLTSKFTDLNKDEWYYPFISTAESLNLINGISDTAFGVGNNITRQDMAVMVVRLVSTLNLELPLQKEKVLFADDNLINDYAKVSVYTMQRSGIINGYEDNTFAPDAFAIRAEAAKIIFQLCELIMK